MSPIIKRPRTGEAQDDPDTLRNASQEEDLPDPSLQPSEPQVAKRRRKQPSRAAKAEAENLIRQIANARKRAYVASKALDGDIEFDDTIHQADRRSIYSGPFSSDESTDEYSPEQYAQSSQAVGRAIGMDRDWNVDDEHVEVISDEGSFQEIPSAQAGLDRLTPAIQDPLGDTASNLTPETTGAPVTFEATSMLDVIENRKQHHAITDIHREQSHESESSDDSSDLSSANSVTNLEREHQTRDTPQGALPVKIEGLDPEPLTLTSKKDVSALPDEPMPAVERGVESFATSAEPVNIGIPVHDAEAKDTPHLNPRFSRRGSTGSEVLRSTREIARAPVLLAKSTEPVNIGNTDRDIRAEETPYRNPRVPQSNPPLPEVLSVTKEMARAREARESIREQPPMEAYVDQAANQPTTGEQGRSTAPSSSALSLQPARGISEPMLPRQPRLRPILPTLPEGTVKDLAIPVQPTAGRGPVNYPPGDHRMARQGIPAAQLASRLTCLHFRDLTTNSDADLGEFIHAMRAHVLYTDKDFFDCMKRYLTKKDVLRKLEQRSDYQDLVLSPATAPNIAITLHHALVHTLRILDAERGTSRHLAGHVHHLDDEFSIKYPRPAKAMRTTAADQQHSELQAQPDASGGTSKAYQPVTGSVSTIPREESANEATSSTITGGARLAKTNPTVSVLLYEATNEPSRIHHTHAWQDKATHRRSASNHYLHGDTRTTALISEPKIGITATHVDTSPDRAGESPETHIAPLVSSEEGNDYNTKMRRRVSRMKAGEIYPPCDGCARKGIVCVPYAQGSTRCYPCYRSGMSEYCTWNHLNEKEMKWIDNTSSDPAWRNRSNEQSQHVVTDQGGQIPRAQDLQRTNQGRMHPSNQNLQHTPAGPISGSSRRNPNNDAEAAKPSYQKHLETSEDLTREMRARMHDMKRWEKVPFPCDQCRKHGLECLVYDTKCFDCQRKNKQCYWTDIDPAAVDWLNQNTAHIPGELEMLKDVVVLD